MFLWEATFKYINDKNNFCHCWRRKGVKCPNCKKNMLVQIYLICLHPDGIRKGAKWQNLIVPFLFKFWLTSVYICNLFKTYWLVWKYICHAAIRIGITWTFSFKQIFLPKHWTDISQTSRELYFGGPLTNCSNIEYVFHW